MSLRFWTWLRRSRRRTRVDRRLDGYVRDVAQAPAEQNKVNYWVDSRYRVIMKVTIPTGLAAAIRRAEDQSAAKRAS